MQEIHKLPIAIRLGFVKRTVGVWSPNPIAIGFGDQTPTIKYYNLFRIAIYYKTISKILSSMIMVKNYLKNYLKIYRKKTGLQLLNSHNDSNKINYFETENAINKASITELPKFIYGVIYGVLTSGFFLIIRASVLKIRVVPNGFLILQKFRQTVWSLCLITIILLWTNQAIAGPLADRIANFPNWVNKPSISAAETDLIYPDWMAGNWNVKSTLIDMVAPLAPEIVTPGFENNRKYLHQPVNFQVRFMKFKPKIITAKTPQQKLINLPISWNSVVDNINIKKWNLPENAVIADREFNGLNIAKAVLGENSILSVKIDPNNPNRQTTILPNNLELVSVVTSRGSEILNPEEFVGCEITQQIFESDTMIYLNEVETTTKYYHILDEKQREKIEADQITAIYLSPQDPDYFVAANRPVALYRYQLELLPKEVKNLE